VLDVDGTLVTSDARLTPATRAAVGRATAHGLEVCLATSRGPGGLRWLLDRLGLDLWAVTYQGALAGRLGRAGGLAGGVGPHKLMLIAGRPELLPALHALAGRLPDDCAGYFSHDNYLEVTRAGVDKAGALARLAGRLQIPLAETAAVGDGQNDLGLLGAVGLPVAMGNATPALKQVATWVVASNDEDGAAAALHRLVEGV
jgi:hydroxymethylpyrimidine pyrophosphatase-like HAD family hydrolase